MNFVHAPRAKELKLALESVARDGGVVGVDREADIVPSELDHRMLHHCSVRQ